VTLIWYLEVMLEECAEGRCPDGRLRLRQAQDERFRVGFAPAFFMGGPSTSSGRGSHMTRKKRPPFGGAQDMAGGVFACAGASGAAWLFSSLRHPKSGPCGVAADALLHLAE
jgi:hypothetical protein